MSLRRLSSRALRVSTSSITKRAISQGPRKTQALQSQSWAQETPLPSIVPSFLDTPSPKRPHFDHIKAAKTLPPNYNAQIRELKTFHLPETVTGSAADRALGKALVDAWRADGILQIAFPPALQVLNDAVKQSKKYFGMAHEDKSKCLDDQSFAGYIASGEEITDGIADYSEIFTVTKDLDDHDPRVRAKWPCHGPCPWPSTEFSQAIKQLMEYKGKIGETLLHLTGLGLGLEDPMALNKLTADGWHHMRVLRFPPTQNTNGKGKEGRGIGSHTDYGLLVIAAQDEVGGLFVRPPYKGENYANWTTSAAGLHENDDKWVYVAPVENVFTCFPGDMMQFITNSFLPSTPHKVGLNTRERFAFAYFHEPNFNAVCKRMPQFASSSSDTPASSEPHEDVHYGTHFTNMFMRNYPDRITAHRMRAENRQSLLKPMREANGFSFN